MAELFIKVRHSLYDDEKTNAIERALELPKGQTVGLLGHAWIWASSHAPGGHAPTATHEDVDKVTIPGFAEAMEAVGWLDSSKGGLLFPEFERHNINTHAALAVVTKRKTREKVARWRAQKKQHNDTPQDVTDVTVTGGYKEVTKGLHPSPPYKKKLENEKENINTPLPPEGESGGSVQKARKRIRREEDAPDLAEVARTVIARYRECVRSTHPEGGAVVAVMKLLQAGRTAEELVVASERYGAARDAAAAPFDKRQMAANFFGEDGAWKTPPPAKPVHVPPPRIKLSLHLPSNDLRVNAEADAECERRRAARRKLWDETPPDAPPAAKAG